MAKRNILGGDNSPSDEITHADINSHILSNIKRAEGEKIVARPIDIFSIIPDVTQPRRAIPFSVRRSYENSAQNIPLMLEEWHIITERAIGQTIEVRETITHGGEGLDIEPSSLPSIVSDYLDLLGLAASIHREGLTNAITVSDAGDYKRIETGERRYLAHHLLTMYVDEVKYSKIAAQEVKRDVWRQASENGARKPLNAIGLARQLALLIMDMYQGDKDVFFDKFEALILPGECDRRFYAQVANGNRYRIKRGMSQKILDVTGLKSRSQIQQYRNLLSLTDELWIEADENDYTEFRIRSILDEINNTNKSGRFTAENDDMSPTGDITHENQRYEAPVRPSALPDRPAPQAPVQRVPPPINPQRTEPDPDLDDVYFEDDEDSEPTFYQEPTLPEPQRPTQSVQRTTQLEDPYIDNKRKMIAPTLHALIAFSRSYHGREMELSREESVIYEGNALAEYLNHYLNCNLKQIVEEIDRQGEEKVRADLTNFEEEIITLLRIILFESVHHIEELIDTSLDVFR